MAPLATSQMKHTGMSSYVCLHLSYETPPSLVHDRGCDWCHTAGGQQVHLNPLRGRRRWAGRGVVALGAELLGQMWSTSLWESRFSSGGPWSDERVGRWALFSQSSPSRRGWVFWRGSGGQAALIVQPEMRFPRTS